MANRKFYRNRPRSNHDQDRKAAVAAYGEEKLSLTLEELGLSDASRELLSANRVTTAGDLVVRTEKDMYKVQGLNKRVLFEVKDALAKRGMSLFVERKEDVPEKAEEDKKAEVKGKAKQPKKEDAQKAPARAVSDGQNKAKKQDPSDQKPQNAKKREEQRPAREGNASSRFGLADRKDGKARATERRERERITEPLPVELWRKVMKGGKWGFSDGFKTVIPPMYDEVFSFREGLASVEIDGKCGYIDAQNNVVIPLDYDLAMSFSEGFAMVAKGDKCGYINKNNEIAFDFEYDAATAFEDGEAKVKKDGKWATLTPDGKLTWI